MAGRRRQKIISSFYCINCGRRGLPVWRDRSHQREKGHRKVLYCTNCRLTINHIEIRTMEEAERFLEDYEAGKYAEEAKESIAYVKEHKLTQ